MAKGDMAGQAGGAGYNTSMPGTMGRVGMMGGFQGGSTPYGAPTQAPNSMAGAGEGMMGGGGQGSIGPSPNIMQTILAMMQGGGGMMRNPGMMGAQGPAIGQGFGQNTQGRFNMPTKPGQTIMRESSQS